MRINVWSKVAVAVQTVLAAAVALTAITKANPAVASATAHGYANGDVLLLRVNGMTQLDYAVVRVANQATGTFELEGIDSTTFDTFIATGSTAQKITFGANASTFQDVSASGGEAADIEIKTIHTDQDRVIPGNRTPLSFSFGSLWDVSDPALKALKSFDNIKSPCAIMFRFATGDLVYFAAVPSTSLAPGGSAGNAVTTPVKLNVSGVLSYYVGA